MGGHIVGEGQVPWCHAPDHTADIETESSIGREGSDGGGDDIADAVGAKRVDVAGRVASRGESEDAGTAIHLPDEEVVDSVTDGVVIFGRLVVGEREIERRHDRDHATDIE